MIRKLTSISIKHTSLALLLTSTLAAASWAAPAAQAASEAVYISNASYFTLNQAALSSSSLQFSVALHNGDQKSIDFNQYGVRVTDTSGHSYTAKLSEKKSASVLPGQDASFRFYASLGEGETADQLKVDVFRWDASQADFMNHLGDLPVASALQENQVKVPEEIINLRTLDSTLPNDASVAFQLGQSVRVSENGKWVMYTQVSAKNLGSSSVKLPAGLQVRLVDANGLKYTSTVAEGAGTSFLPSESDTITLKTPISKQLSASGLSLEFYFLNQTEDVSLGTMNLNASLQTTALNTKQTYSGQQDGEQVTVKANSSTYSKQSDGVHVQTVVTLSNDGEASAAVPSFFASYQFGDSGTSISATDNSARNAYLAPKETTTYYFNAILPAGVDPNAAQLVLWEKTATSTSSSSAASSGAANGSGTSSSATSGQMPVAVFQLQGATEAQSGFTTAASYTLGSKLTLSNSSVINKNLDVSLVELHAHQNDDLGYKTAIAKYKITNNGTSTIALPELQNELIDSSGNAYTGTRQTSVTTQVTPGSSYVVSYSYLLPNKKETENETFALNIFDDKSVSQGKVSVGTYKVALQEEADSDILALYPFTIKVNSDSISWLYNNGTYSYQLNLDLDVTHEDQVIVDANFSKVEFDMVDSLGRVVGTQSASLLGSGKLVSGKQKVVVSGLKDEQVDSGVKVYMYEVIETPNGTAKRLIKQFH
ncbi:hypothetical protein GCM10008018_64670 [Paenibacillus marchantiophytorum]|uniref:Uncharacterized protein n=1 Tax=Paenibacillus marchantiophytorum TaxID=1619310 RepID=A0ABQ1FGZ0_9BACL|nr:hypothetical protein [Paenibacillus marchantiophytorum]GGA10298.1 hypothetical protein GCM10008018_64670 [Paenibacillus marchantiophytorum]